MWISHPGLTGEPVFPGILYPSIPSGSCHRGVGSLCLNRALRSCSADPLPPGSATLTFLLPTVLCCPQASTAPAPDPCCPSRLHHGLGSSSASSSGPFLTPALGGAFLRQGCCLLVRRFISLRYSFLFPESKALLGEPLGSGNSQITSLCVLLLGY